MYYSFFEVNSFSAGPVTTRLPRRSARRSFKRIELSKKTVLLPSLKLWPAPPNVGQKPRRPHRLGNLDGHGLACLAVSRALAAQKSKTPPGAVYLARVALNLAKSSILFHCGAPTLVCCTSGALLNAGMRPGGSKSLPGHGDNVARCIPRFIFFIFFTRCTVIMQGGRGVGGGIALTCRSLLPASLQLHPSDWRAEGVNAAF